MQRIACCDGPRRRGVFCFGNFNDTFSLPSMPNPFNFTISDTSPIFHYFPTQDGPIDSSWNASFSGSSDSTWVPESLGIGVRSFFSDGIPSLSSSTPRPVHIGQHFQVPQYAWIGLGLPSICTVMPLLERILSKSTALLQMWKRTLQGCFLPSLTCYMDHTG